MRRPSLFWRAWSSGGHWRLGQRQAALKGLNHPDGWRYHRAIQTLEMSSGRLDAGTARLYRDLLERYRPRFLRGYPSSMYLFCRLLRDEGLEAHVPMVISGSEMLHDFQRAMIESVLRTRIYNHYTHWERAASILECDAGRMHAQEDYAHHEILDRDGEAVPPGMPGEITTTGLYNLAMPLVRYRTGDIARWTTERCPCGQTFPAVERIEGRQNDYLVSQSGALVPSTYAVTGFKAFPELLYIQIIQHDLEGVEVRIVKVPSYRDPEDTGPRRAAHPSGPRNEARYSFLHHRRVGAQPGREDPELLQPASAGDHRALRATGGVSPRRTGLRGVPSGSKRKSVALI
jgi:phenylacetate-coenzyme A ligase PaaK-like adenylate-forming protein